MRYINSEITKLELAEIVDDVICRVKALEDNGAASTSTKPCTNRTHVLLLAAGETKCDICGIEL